MTERVREVPPDREGRRIDAERVATQLSALMPGRIISARHLEPVFDSPDEFVRFDDDAVAAGAGTVCRVWVGHAAREVRVAWLLPEDAGIDALLPVFAAAMTAALDAHPEAADYLVFAEFKIERGRDGWAKANAWRDRVFVDAPPPERVTHPSGSEYARISMAHFGDAVAVLRARARVRAEEGGTR